MAPDATSLSLRLELLTCTVLGVCHFPPTLGGPGYGLAFAPLGRGLQHLSQQGHLPRAPEGRQMKVTAPTPSPSLPASHFPSPPLLSRTVRIIIF